MYPRTIVSGILWIHSGYAAGSRLFPCDLYTAHNFYRIFLKFSGIIGTGIRKICYFLRAEKIQNGRHGSHFVKKIFFADLGVLSHFEQKKFFSLGKNFPAKKLRIVLTFCLLAIFSTFEALVAQKWWQIGP